MCRINHNVHPVDRALIRVAVPGHDEIHAAQVSSNGRIFCRISINSVSASESCEALVWGMMPERDDPFGGCIAEIIGQPTVAIAPLELREAVIESRQMK